MSFHVGQKVGLAPCHSTGGCEAAWVVSITAKTLLVRFDEDEEEGDVEAVALDEATPWGTRFPMLEPRAPAALLFLHIEKTGGTAIRNWLHHNDDGHAEAARLQLLSPGCFQATMRASSLVGVMCSSPAPAPWNRSVTAVEYHSGSAKQAFWTAAPYARAVYVGAAGGRLVAATLVQKPSPHLLSTYRMWPPISSGALVPLARWLPDAAGIQARYVVANAPRAGGSNCSAVADAAVARLATLDIVGLTGCLASFVAELELHLGLEHAPHRTATVLRHHVPPTVAGPPGAKATELERAVWRETDPAWRDDRLLQEAAECDQPLYAAAKARFCSRAHLWPKWALCEECNDVQHAARSRRRSRT
tara:strand:- start:135 stop:1217 length:1083 start_codon:yes stop_codon:yes gene_type:complete